MPKRKRYEDSSRSQQWCQRQETVYTLDNMDTKIEIHEERPNDNTIVKNSNNSNNNDIYMSEDKECSTEEFDVKSELIDEYDSQCYEDLNFNLQKEPSSKENSQEFLEMNTDEDIHATLNSLYEKVNTLHEDFQQFKKEMRNEAARNKTQIQKILVILRDKFSRNEEDDEVNMNMNLLPELPLTSVEEYMRFNDRLKKDEAIRKCFDRKIKCIGGDSIQKTVSNIFTNCITFELGHKLSWTGAKNSIAIGNSTFANIIVEAVSHTKGKESNCTIATIVKHIKNWLQHAGDKMRYRMKKVKKYDTE